MADCRICKYNYKYPFLDCEPKCNLMCENYSDFKAITNADYIRAMSDEELAYFLAHETYRVVKPVFDLSKVENIEDKIYCLRLQWLKQPVEVEE